MIEFFRTQILNSKLVQLFICTVLKWQQDECLEMGAALAYYALFSLFPIFLVILSIFGFLVGPTTDAYNEILWAAEGSLPPSAFRIIESTLLHLNQTSVSAGIVGFFILFFTASSIFGALGRSVDKIWKVPRGRHVNHNLISIALTFIKNRIFAFTLVLGAAALTLISLLSHIAIKVLLRIVENFSQAIKWIQINDLVLLKGLQVGTTFLILTLVVMVLFKILPSTRVTWGDVWLGALITVTLLTSLQHLVSHSVIQIGVQYQSYGVIGSVMVLLLWIYLTCQIFFLGSELTYVYAHLFGSRRNQ